MYLIKDLKGIVIHGTSATNKGADARANRQYFNNVTNRYASAHYLVDDHEILQTIPDNEVAYHAGDSRIDTEVAKRMIGSSNLNPNYFTIGIELCENIDGDSTLTYRNSVSLAAFLLRKHSLSIDQLYRHSDITGKDCPKFFLAEPAWAKFKSDVSRAMRQRTTITLNDPSAIPLPDMVFVQGGTFQMGSPESNPDRSNNETQHAVTLADYSIGKTEVTVAQYMAFANETKTHYPEWLEAGNEYNIQTGTDNHYKELGTALQEPDHPIVGISWDDAVAYCQWLSQKTGRKYRLPTEAEWEYAARGGQRPRANFQYAGSNNLEEVGWYADNSDAKTYPVGGKKPSNLGLYDMSGNVYEWCSDWYGGYPAGDGKSILNPTGPIDGLNRVYRGGSWDDDAQFCRVSLRGYGRAEYPRNYLGFRLASSPQ